MQLPVPLLVLLFLLLNTCQVSSFLSPRQQQQQRHSAFQLSSRSAPPLTTTTSTTLSNFAWNIRSRLQLRNFTSSDVGGSSEDNDDVDVVATSSSASGTPTPPNSSSADDGISKFRKLKDLMWVRETREDLTAAEFAATIDASVEEGRKRKRAIDYGNLMAQLDRRLSDITAGASNNDDADAAISRPIPGQGMGSIVITQQQREELFDRLLHAKTILTEAMRQTSEASKDGGDGDGGDGGDSNNKTPLSLDGILPEFPNAIDIIPTKELPKLYVRDDGTVDWDGALQDREAFQQFGARVWARINGRDPETVSEDDVVVGGTSTTSSTGTTANSGSTAATHKTEAAAVTAKIEETVEIRQEREELERLKADLATMELEHTQLLTSAISAGQAVANINLALLEPDLRSKIQESSAALEAKKEAVSFQTLIYDLERIYTYLSLEMGSTTAVGKVPLQDRLSVAEFGLLESQMEAFHRQLDEAGDDDAGVLDADVLQVVLDQVTDLKRRLGIDYMVTGLTFNQANIKQWLGESFGKTKEGLAFYVKGCKLFWNDIVFCLSLFGRALSGYILKPREVRYLRRTFKDVTLFIPFIVILLIPLSPVGHVLVFGAIQRVFPDFFPSCFTESRQNLLQLYESTEYSELSINEPLGERLSRILEALAYQMVNWIRRVIASLSVGSSSSGGSSSSSSSSDEGSSSEDKGGTKQ